MKYPRKLGLLKSGSESYVWPWPGTLVASNFWWAVSALCPVNICPVWSHFDSHSHDFLKNLVPHQLESFGACHLQTVPMYIFNEVTW